jgi:1-acylglycerone phosphate reductase
MVEHRSGQIVNVGSVVGLAATPWSGIYNSSKVFALHGGPAAVSADRLPRVQAALHSLTDTLTMELAPFGIKVTLVVPGAVKSKFGQRQLETVSMPDGKTSPSLFSKQAATVLTAFV